MVDIDRPQVAGGSRASLSRPKCDFFDLSGVFWETTIPEMKCVTTNAPRGTLFPLGVTVVTVVVPFPPLADSRQTLRRQGYVEGGLAVKNVFTAQN